MIRCNEQQVEQLQKYIELHAIVLTPLFPVYMWNPFKTKSHDAMETRYNKLKNPVT